MDHIISPAYQNTIRQTIHSIKRRVAVDQLTDPRALDAVRLLEQALSVEHDYQANQPDPTQPAKDTK